MLQRQKGAAIYVRWVRAAKHVAAAVLALTIFSVNAAEISFYEHEGFSGRQLNLRSMTTNFDTVSFNDRANSIRVRSGTWLVCTDAEFRGTCATFAPGEYRSLDDRFANAISSAREVEIYRAQLGDYPGRSRATIEFFDQPEYGGQTLLLDADAENFSAAGFNDRAVSIIISGGTWELCTDAGYRGDCRIYTPGRYSDLGLGMAREISSARLVSGNQDYPNLNGAAADGNNNIGKLVLYDADGFLGRGMSISGNLASLERTGFNDAAQSIVIEQGTWEFCTDADFRGACRVLGPGYYRRLDPELYRTISSIRASAASSNSMGGRRSNRNPNDGGELVIYDHVSFTGRSFSARSSIDNLVDKDFNDRAQSLIIYAGRWQLCTDANYAGRCVVFGPGRYENLQDLNNKLSSFKRLP